MQASDIDEVDRRIAELANLAELRALPLNLWQLRMAASCRALLDGRCDDAEVEATAAFEVGTAGGQAEAMLAYGAQLLEIRRHQGRLGEMVAFIEQIPAENAAAAGFRQLLAAVYCDLGHLSEARPLLALDVATEFGEVPRDEAWLTMMSCCASVATALHDRDASRMLYEQLRPYERRIAAVYASVSGAVARHLGCLATGLERYDDAEPHFRVALELHERIRAPYWIACTQLDLRDMRARRGAPGDDARVRELGDHAREIARDRAVIAPSRCADESQIVVHPRGLETDHPGYPLGAVMPPGQPHIDLSRTE